MSVLARYRLLQIDLFGFVQSSWTDEEGQPQALLPESGKGRPQQGRPGGAHIRARYWLLQGLCSEARSGRYTPGMQVRQGAVVRAANAKPDQKKLKPTAGLPRCPLAAFVLVQLAVLSLCRPLCVWQVRAPLGA